MGKLKIMDSQEEAVRAAVEAVQESAFLRLVLVYDNAELRQVIRKEETCNSKSAMYMVVSATYPAYYLELCEPESGGQLECEIDKETSFAEKSSPMTDYLGPPPGAKMRPTLWMMVNERMQPKPKSQTVSCMQSVRVGRCMRPRLARVSAVEPTHGGYRNHALSTTAALTRREKERRAVINGNRPVVALTSPSPPTKSDREEEGSSGRDDDESGKVAQGGEPALGSSQGSGEDTTLASGRRGGGAGLTTEDAGGASDVRHGKGRRLRPLKPGEEENSETDEDDEDEDDDDLDASDRQEDEEEDDEEEKEDDDDDDDDAKNHSSTG